METFDVVIVGARCAGSPLAAMLARQGLRVCLLDRARFPSETPSTHGIQPCGVRILDELGVFDPILATGAVPIDRFTIVNDSVRIEATLNPRRDHHPALCVRRLTLDALLVNAAAEAGAEVHTGVAVRRLVMAKGRVAGVETDIGRILAHLVVGADGRQSAVASLAGAKKYHVCPPGRMAAWAYFDGVGDRNSCMRFARIGELGFLASPTDGGLYMTVVAINFDDQAAFHANRSANFIARINEWPELSDIIAGAKRVGPVRVMTRWHGYFRRAAGPGWVLVGDAGLFKDFATGQGISDALRQAKSLAEAIGEGFSDARIDAAMRRWWRWRDQDAYEMYWFACDMGAPGALSPLMTRVVRGIAADPDATQTLVRVLNHEVSPSRLLTMPRLARAAAGALYDKPEAAVATLHEIANGGLRNARRTLQRRPTRLV